MPVIRNIEKETVLQELETEFDEMRHPEGTTPVARQKTTGLLTDTSEACDFFIGEIRSYGGDNNQIVDWYAGQKAGDEEISLIFIDNRDIATSDQVQFSITLASLSQWELDLAQQNQPLYIVCTFLSGNEADIKIECQ